MRKLYKKLPNPVNRTVKFPISQFHFDHHNPEARLGPASAAYQDVPLIRRRLSPSVPPATDRRILSGSSPTDTTRSLMSMEQPEPLLQRYRGTRLLRREKRETMLICCRDERGEQCPPSGTMPRQWHLSCSSYAHRTVVGLWLAVGADHQL